MFTWPRSTVGSASYYRSRGWEFVKVDHEIISSHSPPPADLRRIIISYKPSADIRMVIVCYKLKYVHNDHSG